MVASGGLVAGAGWGGICRARWALRGPHWRVVFWVLRNHRVMVASPHTQKPDRAGPRGMGLGDMGGISIVHISFYHARHVRRTHTHTCMRVCMHACMHAYIQTYTHKQAHTIIQRGINHAGTHTHIHTYVQKNRHTHMHTHNQNTHTYIQYGIHTQRETINHVQAVYIYLQYQYDWGTVDMPSTCVIYIYIIIHILSNFRNYTIIFSVRQYVVCWCPPTSDWVQCVQTCPNICENTYRCDNIMLCSPWCGPNS